MPFSASVGAVLLSFIAATASGISFNPDDDNSIRTVTKQYAADLMSLYQNGAPGVSNQNVGTWPKPYYWWEGGAAWGGMIEYTQITGDGAYVKTLQQALTANYGSDKDFILPYRHSETGNDDQAFWGLAVMSALEYGFPEPDNTPATYLEVAVNTFKNIVSRWDETSCGGGLRWQVYPDNAYGWNYKNSISAGTAFALASRLARYTGEQEYADWAVKIYNWTSKVGLISNDFEVFDGTDDRTNCANVGDKTQWTYNSAMFMHGCASLYDFTKGDKTWGDRTSGFLGHATSLFFRPYDNATDIMYEWACETGESGRHCNLDQQSFKAYLGRFMAKTAVLAPFTRDAITKSLKGSAVGAAKSCTGEGKAICGSKWYTGNYDFAPGVGQQLSALEITQSLLLIKQNTLPAKNGAYAAQQAPSAAPVSSSVKRDQPITQPAASSKPTTTALVSLQGIVPTGDSACNTRTTTTTIYIDPPKQTLSCTPSTATTSYIPAKPTSKPPVYNATTTSMPPTFTGAAAKIGMSGYEAGAGAMVLALIAGLV